MGRTLVVRDRSRGVEREFDEDEIVDVLRRNDWLVVPMERVQEISVSHEIFTPDVITDITVFLPKDMIPAIEAAVRRGAIESIADKLAVRVVPVAGGKIEFRCRALVIPEET